MRDLSADKNILVIKDGISGDEHEIYYRRPTAKEIAEHQARMFERKGKKVVNKVHATRIESGMKIITGFKPGTLGYQGQAFSPYPGDKEYREDWQRLMRELAPDIVSAVAQQVFEGTGVSHGDVEIVYEADGEPGHEVNKDAGPLDSGTTK